MKIRMTTSMAGAGFVLGVDEETDRFGEAEAIRLIEAGFAVPVSAKVERAVKAPKGKETR